MGNDFCRKLRTKDESEGRGSLTHVVAPSVQGVRYAPDSAHAVMGTLCEPPWVPPRANGSLKTPVLDALGNFVGTLCESPSCSRGKPAQTVVGSLSAQRPACPYGDGCYRGDTMHWSSCSHPGDPDHPRRAALPAPPISARDRLFARDGSFQWVQRDNEKEDRTERLRVVARTLAVCRAGGFYMADSRVSVRFRHIAELAARTRFVSAEEVRRDIRAVRSKKSRTSATKILAAKEATAMDAALARARKGKKVALLSAASAFSPGGGFRTGGRHSFEEALCVQSTIVVSLQQAFWLSRQGESPPPFAQGLARYIPEECVVLSPSVEVFRDGTATGYSFLEKPVELQAVVSVAMPNCNAHVRDCPVDAPEDPAVYLKLLVTKFQVALGAAWSAGADSVVVPGLGCGVFRNDPIDVGRALGEALGWGPLSGVFKEVTVAGAPPEMLKAANELIASSRR